jgi:hypothetical protein
MDRKDRTGLDGCLFWFALVIGTATFIAAISIAIIGGI